MPPTPSLSIVLPVRLRLALHLLLRPQVKPLQHGLYRRRRRIQESDRQLARTDRSINEVGQSLLSKPVSTSFRSFKTAPDNLLYDVLLASSAPQPQATASTASRPAVHGLGPVPPQDPALLRLCTALDTREAVGRGATHVWYMVVCCRTKNPSEDFQAGTPVSDMRKLSTETHEEVVQHLENLKKDQSPYVRCRLCK